MKLSGEEISFLSFVIHLTFTIVSKAMVRHLRGFFLSNLLFDKADKVYEDWAVMGNRIWCMLGHQAEKPCKLCVDTV